MYGELVKELRDSAEWADRLALLMGRAEGDTHAPIMRKAADAIEELQLYADLYKDLTEKGEKVAREVIDKYPKWIPVTERLPEEYVNVLCYYEYFRYGDYNCMFRTIDRGYYGDGRWGGEAGQGHKNKVLAWMPLPQPPEED